MVLLNVLVNIDRLSRNGGGGRKGVAGEAKAEEEKGDDCDELHGWLLLLLLLFDLILILFYEMINSLPVASLNKCDQGKIVSRCTQDTERCKCLCDIRLAFSLFCFTQPHNIMSFGLVLLLKKEQLQPIQIPLLPFLKFVSRGWYS